MPDRSAPSLRLYRWAASLGLVLAAILSVPTRGDGSELRQTPIVKAVQRVQDSVVSIRGEKTVVTAAAQPTGVDTTHRVNGMGTGVVIDPRGYIITNFHVVDSVRDIQVTLTDGRHYVARLLARDAETDLAIIKIDCPQEIPPIPLGTSSDLMPGETVIAVGNAYGYEHTVTRGIVSALHRAVQVSDAQFYDDLIQTDASINPGNSGGPLLNIDGEMIGINVAVRAGAQGIGFAIPADKATAIAAKLLASGSAQKAAHGIVTGPDGPPSDNGVVVSAVEKKSPAAESGLQPGDVISGVGEQEVKRSLDLQRALIERKAGEKVELAVHRGHETLKLSLTLAQVPPRKAPAQPAWETLGLELKAISPQEFREAHQTHYRGGLEVVDVRPDSPAAAQGIRPGDVLVGVHAWETISLDNVAYILKRPDFATLSPIKFYILRGNETLYGYLPVNLKTVQR